MVFPKISLITPCYNQVNYIEDCILSILNQDYPNLEYIIIDGGSTDGTVEVIKKYEAHLYYWVSEKDEGIYDALRKGFSKSTGEVMGWLNSDDMLHQKSLFTIQDIFSSFREVNWLQGYPTVIEDKGRIVYHRAPRASKFSFYLRDYHDGIFIQQESTYWRRTLWERAGAFISTDYKFAGDFELWMRFFLHENLFTTNALVGAFRIRKEGQLSTENYSAYLQECDETIEKNIPLLNKNDRLVLNRLLMIRRLRSLIHNIDQWPFIRNFIRRKLGRPFMLKYNFKEQKFYITK